MSDDEERRDPLEDAMRAAGLDPDQVRDWINGAGEWLKTQLADAVAATTPSGEDVLRSDVPDPLDVPTAEQGAPCAALDSGRWKIDPETSALASDGDGPPRPTRSARPWSCACATGSTATARSPCPAGTRSSRWLDTRS